MVTAITPMFSAYVVTPVPPPAPATIVARPSAKNARPMYGSRFRPVIVATALTCPRFSATRTIATGTMSVIACESNCGAVSAGQPRRGAALMALKSIGVPPRPRTFDRSQYRRYPKMPPIRMGRRRNIPGA